MNRVAGTRSGSGRIQGQALLDSPLVLEFYGERLAQNTSATPFVSFENVKLVANESNAKKENAGLLGLPLNRSVEFTTADPFGCVAASRCTRTVCPVVRLWTKTSAAPLVSPLTRFVALETNA